MSKEEELQIELQITGFNDSPEEITSLTGLNPTKIIRKGEPRDINTASSYKENAWIRGLSIPDDGDTEERMAGFINELIDRSSEIVELSGKYKCLLSISGYVFQPQVGFHFNSKLLQDIASLNLSLDIDVYSLRGNNLEQEKQKRALEGKIISLGSDARLGDGSEEKAHRYVEGLSSLEKDFELMTDSLIPDLFWEDQTEEEFREANAKLKSKLKTINEDIEKLELKAGRLEDGPLTGKF